MSSIRRDRAHFPVSRRAALAKGGLDRGGSLSIVIPSKDEASNLRELVEQVVRAFRPLVDRAYGRHRLDRFEVVVVDDGSTDETRAVLRELVKTYPELRPISLSENVGQSGATIAGFRVATGDWVGMLDADLQNPPEDLAKLWDALPGFDAALGWRSNREDVPSRRLISRVANRVRNLVLGQSIKDTGCSVRIFPRDVALRLPAFQGVHRFFGPLLLREGCRIIQMPVGTPPEVVWEVALPFWQPLDPGRRRPPRGRLVAPEAGSLRRCLDGGSADPARLYFDGRGPGSSPMTNAGYWQVVGFLGQGVFTARFLVQWVASEKKGDSVVPIAFWWLSILGGFSLLIYAVYRRDPVFIVGQGMGMVVYVRNLMLVARKERRASRPRSRRPKLTRVDRASINP